MLVQCWSSVVDGGPTLNQHCHFVFTTSRVCWAAQCELYQYQPWTSPHRKGGGRGFLYSFYTGKSAFLSPARIGHEIIVYIGYFIYSSAEIPSGVRRQIVLCRCTYKLVVTFFVISIGTTTFLTTRGCVSEFLKMLPKFKMAARGQFYNFSWWWFSFVNHFLSMWRCANLFLKMLPKCKMAATDQLHSYSLWAVNNLKSEIILSLLPVAYHIPHDKEVCRWFFKVLLDFKMAATDQLSLKNLKSEIIQILQSH